MNNGSWRNRLFAGACIGVLAGCLLVSGCETPPAGEKPAAQESETMRMSFQELFDVNGTTVTPKKIIKSGSTTMAPEVPFESNVLRLDDAPFSDFIGRDAEVKKEQGIYRIVRFY